MSTRISSCNRFDNDGSAAFDSNPSGFSDIDPRCFEEASAAALARKLSFRRITEKDMSLIWPLLKLEPGRSTDFSYGGLLMWVDFFHYEFAILNNTLFIKGRVEDDLSKVAFSLPVGDMPLSLSIPILRNYCEFNNLPLILSAVPEYALHDLRNLADVLIEEISDWEDYLYDAHDLASLSGKKFSKKRNHINQFLNTFPDYSLDKLTADNAAECISFMDKMDMEGDNVDMAVTERRLNREVLKMIQSGDTVYQGAVLRDADNNILAFTIGDIKDDTLFVHIEKALREAPGAFEMINKAFAEKMTAEHPEIKFINREDDAGDMGLRLAKESYRPVAMIRKFNVSFI